MASTSRQPAGEPDFSLGQIVDDDTPRNDAIAWALGEIDTGRSVESVTADLAAGGWSATDAESIADGYAAQLRRRVSARQHAANAFGIGDPNVQRNLTSTPADGGGGALAPFIRAFFRLWKTNDAGRPRNR